MTEHTSKLWDFQRKKEKFDEQWAIIAEKALQINRRRLAELPVGSSMQTKVTNTIHPCVTPLHATSRHFTPLHATSRHFAPPHATSRHFTPRWLV